MDAPSRTLCDATLLASQQQQHEQLLLTCSSLGADGYFAVEPAAGAGYDQAALIDEADTGAPRSVLIYLPAAGIAVKL